MSGFVQVNFRMPAELKEKLEFSADKNGRSITSELVTRLEQSFAAQVINLQGQGIAPPEEYKASTKINRKFIFTEWHPLHDLEEIGDFMIYNERVRMSCAEYMSGFFNDHPTYEFISFEFKSRIEKIHRKEQEILYGIRIWYTYPVNGKPLQKVGEWENLDQINFNKLISGQYYWVCGIDGDSSINSGIEHKKEVAYAQYIADGSVYPSALGVCFTDGDKIYYARQYIPKEKAEIFSEEYPPLPPNIEPSI